MSSVHNVPAMLSKWLQLEEVAVITGVEEVDEESRESNGNARNS